MLKEIAFFCDRAQSPLSVAAAALHQGGHYWLSNALESAIAALEDTATYLIWWARPDCDR